LSVRCSGSDGSSACEGYRGCNRDCVVACRKVLFCDRTDSLGQTCD